MFPLALCFLSVAWLMPGHYMPWPAFQSEAVAWLGSALLFAAGLVEGRKPTWSPLALVASAFAIVPLLQWATGLVVFHVDAIVSALYLVSFGMAVATGSSLSATAPSRLLDGLIAALVAAGIASVGLEAWQWLQLGSTWFVADLPAGGRAYANLAQANHLATVLMLGVVGILRWYEIGRLGGPVAALAAAWLGLGLTMTQSRGAWVMAVLLVIWHGLNRRQVAFKLSTVMMAAWAAGFAAAAVGWQRLNQVVNADQYVDVGKRFQEGTRLTHWQTLWDALWQHPWVGYGWSQVSSAQMETVLRHNRTQEVLSNSHSIVLDLLLWNGVPLGLLAIAGFAVWLARQILRCRTQEQWTLLAAVGIVTVHALVEYPLSYTYFLLPLGLMMGALDGIDAGTRRRVAGLKLSLLQLMLVSGLAAWIGFEYMQVEPATRQLRFVTAGIGVQKVSHAPPPDVWLLDGPRQYHEFVNADAEAKLPDDQLEWMKAVAYRYPYAPMLYRYALASGINGRTSEAEHTLTLLCHMHAAQRCREALEGWKDVAPMHPEMGKVHLPEVEADVRAN